jgi:hypothetical protein
MLEFTNEELNILPQWARVAFAARCAHRISVLFQYYWKDAPQNHIDAIELAVCLAAKAARTGQPALPNSATARAGFDAVLATNVDTADDVAFAVDSALSDAYDEVDEISDSTSSIELSLPKSVHAAHEVGHIMAFWPIWKSLVGEKNVLVGSRFVQSAIPVDCDQQVRNAQRYDFLMLKRLTEIHGWDDDSPVDPDLCGPIWPEGVPEKWPLPDPDAENLKQGEYLDLTFDLPSDVDDETVQQLISELYEKLNDHYVAHGGSGLDVDP